MLLSGLASVEKQGKKQSMMPKSSEAGAPQKIATDAMRYSKNAQETILSEILQGCFSRIGNSSLQILYHMTVPEQTNKEKERREGKVTNVKLKGFAFLVCS
jgi:hypothetical protein